MADWHVLFNSFPLNQEILKLGKITNFEVLFLNMPIILSSELFFFVKLYQENHSRFSPLPPAEKTLIQTFCILEMLY
jgi:hypothetical protein